MSEFRFDTAAGVIMCKAELVHGRRSLFIKLAVDTGASFTMISIESALAIGLNPSRAKRHIEITTAGGVVITPIIQIPRFRCFGIEIEKMEAICHNLPPESCVEGLLGLNFLKAAAITIDFSENVIRS